MSTKENELVLKEDGSNGINGDKESKDSKEEMVLDEYNKKEDKENDAKDDKENNEVNTEQILSDTRVDITFSQMNESVMSRESVKTYQSIPYMENKLDLDLPYFSPTKYETVYWKIFHSLSFFLFAAILSTSTWFFYKKQKQIYHISLTISNVFLVISTIMEWNHFKRGCIGYSNLNSKIKKNIDYSFRARVLRSEFGLKYFISFMASIMFIFGNIYYFSFTTNANSIDNPFIDFNLFGMLTLSLSEIMKLEKMLTENKTNSVKSDFSKSLVEILLFFGSLLFGASYMIQLFYLNVDDSPLDKFYIIIRAVGNINFLISSLVLQ
jgi:hypothetical protein